MFSVEEFLKNIYMLSSKDEIDDALYLIFQTFYSLGGMFDIINEIQGQVDVDKIHPHIMVCLLVQTFKYDKQVPNHLVLWNKIDVKLRELGQEEEAEKVLPNLKSAGGFWKNMKELRAPEWLTGPDPTNNKE